MGTPSAHKAADAISHLQGLAKGVEVNQEVEAATMMKGHTLL